MFHKMLCPLAFGLLLLLGLAGCDFSKPEYYVYEGPCSANYSDKVREIYRLQGSAYVLTSTFLDLNGDGHWDFSVTHKDGRVEWMGPVRSADSGKTLAGWVGYFNRPDNTAFPSELEAILAAAKVGPTAGTLSNLYDSAPAELVQAWALAVQLTNAKDEALVALILSRAAGALGNNQQPGQSMFILASYGNRGFAELSKVLRGINNEGVAVKIVELLNETRFFVSALPDVCVVLEKEEWPTARKTIFRAIDAAVSYDPKGLGQSMAPLDALAAKPQTSPEITGHVKKVWHRIVEEKAYLDKMVNPAQTQAAPVSQPARFGFSTTPSSGNSRNSL